MIMTSDNVNDLLMKNFKGSPSNCTIFYGKDKQGKEWQVEDTGKAMVFRPVVKYRLANPTQFTRAFFASNF